MSPNNKIGSKKKAIDETRPNARNASQKKNDKIDRMFYDDLRDLWMLEFRVNEKGIGQIKLPPDLSILLQSETVEVSPSAGGLFIRAA